MEEEVRRQDELFLFACACDPSHPENADVVAEYVRRYQLTVQEGRRAAAGALVPHDLPCQAAEGYPDGTIPPAMPYKRAQHLRRLAWLLRSHPTA
jgi:hypothetical protein